MKVLFCSDGSTQAENAIRFGSIIAAGCQAEATILGIAETPDGQTDLLQALARGQQLLKDKGVSAEITSKAGQAVEEIQHRTLDTKYDLVIIGAVRKGADGPFCMSAKAYKIIKSITPPVLTVIGNRARLQKILICSGGKKYIDKAVELTGRIARCVGARVTLVHVMAEPPRIYSGLIAREENVDRLLSSSSVLGQNLKRVKDALQASGVEVEIRLRHGEILRELLREVRGLEYDLIVAGSAPTRGPFQNYIMGDITREIVNQAECPVLVMRTGEVPPEGFTRFLAELKEAFAKRS